MTAPGRTSPEAASDRLLEDDAEHLYEHAPCGFLSTSPDGLIIRVNETFLSWTGHGRDELLGRRTFADLLTAGGRIYHETHYAPLLRMHGAAREIALDLVTADGGRLPVLVSAVLHRDPTGAPRAVRLAVFEARERREYERELLREKRRAEESEARARALAHTVQRMLVPPQPPDVAGLDLAAVYRPAGTGEEVGGDLYDVFQVSADDWVVVLGDVCGKGVEAAVVAALVRSTIRAVSVQTADPARALSHLDEVLLAHDTERFCTAALLRLHREEAGWRIVSSSGGHPLPLHLRPGAPATQVGEPGPLVGAFSGLPRPESTLFLGPGEALLLHTDGVTEARRGEEFYGEDRLRTVAERGLGQAADLAAAVLEDVLEFQEHLPRDDIAMVVLRSP